MLTLTPYIPSKEDKIRGVHNQIVQDVEWLNNEIQTRLKNNFDAFWNPEGMTVQEVANSFGNETYKLFVWLQVLQTALKTIDPDYEMLIPPQEFTLNEDGTVTIKEPEIIPPPDVV